MGFTSLQFVAFFALVVLVYYGLPIKFQKYVLLLASIGFYLSFGIQAFFLMLVSVVITYMGTYFLDIVHSQKTRKVILAAVLICDLLMLIGLKYSINLRSSLGLVVPIGISFYTLSIMGYAIDVFKKKYPAERNILKFLLFSTFFPHILQGPIARYDKLGIQLECGIKYDFTNISYGIQLMLWGYVKK